MFGSHLKEIKISSVAVPAGDWLRSPGNSNCDKGRLSVSLAEVPLIARPGLEEGEEGRAGSVLVLVTQTVIRPSTTYH